jgi:hypothetical protein
MFVELDCLVTYAGEDARTHAGTFWKESIMPIARSLILRPMQDVGTMSVRMSVKTFRCPAIVSDRQRAKTFVETGT